MTSMVNNAILVEINVPLGNHIIVIHISRESPLSIEFEMSQGKILPSLFVTPLALSETQAK